MWFSSYLREKGVISGDQFADAVREQLSRRPILGKLAIQKRKLSIKQSFQVFGAQADALDEKPFGRRAVELGFLNEAELSELLMEQEDSVPKLGEILVEMGALTSSRMIDELHSARIGLHESKDARQLGTASV